MTTLLKPQNLRRYRDIARLLVKYGRRDLVAQMGIEEALTDEDTDSKVPAQAAELAADLEELGPTYIKLGQLLSTRSDMLPPAYTEALVRLQDNVTPFPFEEVERILGDELGVRPSKAFKQLDAVPLAAASLGQVHHAILRDGREVAVKVQRPGIRKQIDDDLDVFRELAGFLQAHTDFGKRYAVLESVNELQRSLARELDYRQEANNLRTLGRNLKSYEKILIPQPIDDYTTSSVLTMRYVHGTKITELSPIKKTEFDAAALADELFRAYLQQILVDGVVHADPHPGNVFLTHDGRIALIDLGMVAHIPPNMQESLIKLLLAVSEGRGEDAADIAAKISQKTEHFSQDMMRREIANLVVETRDATLDQLEIGRLVLRIAQIAAHSGAIVPSQLTMLGKTLLNLDNVGRILDSSFNPNEAIQRNASKLIRQHMQGSLSLAGVYNTLLETNEFVQQLPNRLNRIFEMVARNELEVQIDAIDETRLIQGLQKIANRITMGLILAALIVGAALMMNVESSLTVLGYPVIAIVLFLGAAGGGIVLVLSMLFSDER